MYIIVAGGGMVGGGLVRSLLDNKHDVVLVERNKELCDKLYAETGVVAICASATSIEALNEAGVRKADVVAGADSIVRVTDLMVNQMMMDIEHPQVRRITTIGGGKADIFMVKVPDRAKVAGRSVQDVIGNRRFPSECVFVAVYNQQTEEFSIPQGQQIINEGNELFLISAAENIKAAADFLTAKNKT